MTSSKHLLAAMLAATVALAGCSTTPQLPERVLIPVAASCPTPTIPEYPTAPPALHDKSATDAEKARALAMYIDQLNGYADALVELLRGYTKPNTQQ